MHTVTIFGPNFILTLTYSHRTQKIPPINVKWAFSSSVFFHVQWDTTLGYPHIVQCCTAGPVQMYGVVQCNFNVRSETPYMENRTVHGKSHHSLCSGAKGCRKRPTVQCTVGLSVYSGNLYGVEMRSGRKHRTIPTVHVTAQYTHATPPYDTVQCTAVSKVVLKPSNTQYFWSAGRVPVHEVGRAMTGLGIKIG